MKLGEADESNLLAQRRLVLLVDLDQTLIHTTNDNVGPDIKVMYVSIVVYNYIRLYIL